MPIATLAIRRARRVLFTAGLAVASLAGTTAFAEPAWPGYDLHRSAFPEDQAGSGRVLAAGLGCVACHAGAPLLPGAPTTAMAPRLQDVPARMGLDWLRRWLADPHGTKPGTVMPTAISPASPRASAVVEDLVHYLASLKPGSESLPKVEPGDVNRGAALYHSVGCVACHESKVPSAEGDTARPRAASIPLGPLAAKWTHAGLAALLKEPLRWHPAGTMPDQRLTDQEAADLATWLRGSAPDPTEPWPRPEPSRVQRGDLLFTSMGCASCHGDGRLPTVPAPAWKDLSSGSQRGCLAESPAAGVPDYKLSLVQRRDLRAALREPETADAGLRASASLAARLCVTCHERNGMNGLGPVRFEFFQTTGADLEDEGRRPPTLTGVGRKLTRTALREVIQGTEAGTPPSSGSVYVRPYMVARMPSFGGWVGDAMAALLETGDLHDDIEPTPRDGDENQVGRNMWGRALVGITGLGCIQCHPLGGHKSLGIQALDLSTVGGRLRPEWFRDYLIDPAAFRPGTRMPAFWPEGKPMVKGNGNSTSRQIDSIWVYLNEWDQSRLPEGMEKKGEFELKPTSQPIVFRTFMEKVGMHAIAVGYPSGRHAAFDAKGVHWSLVWKGRFLDAESTWDDRFTPLAAPLGEEVIDWPVTTAFVLPQGQGKAALPKARFHGYRLDKQGVPTFLYSLGDWEVQDRLLPDPKGSGWRQILDVKGPEGLLCQIPASKALLPTLADGTTPQNGRAPLSWKDGLGHLEILWTPAKTAP